jgi:predicted O-linked N-acetylglucosamine transferase (SPINDLY family)
MPPQTRVEVDPPPLTANGYVTFGCFNNVAKVTPDVVAVWAQILRAVPGSRLRLKWGALKSAELRERYMATFAAHGVPSDRLEMESRSSHADYLRSYGGVDIALDPFPYNGGTTTIDALWMGVPVVSLAGDHFVSRMGLTHLSAVGLADLAAHSEREYVDLAVSLARDASRLRTLRCNLRDRLETSALCDAPRFTMSLEHAFRTMWRTWCATQAAPSD